jgi:opacity protein-like surface antigen
MKLLTTAGIIAITAFPALAGGMTEPVMTTEPVVAVAPAYTGGDWTGGYVGGQLAYGNASVSDIDGDGVSGGLYAGYRYDFGTFVLGAEGGYDWADMTLDGDLGTIDNVGRLKALAGYDMGKTLIYATAGAAYADATVGGANLSDWGWLAGVGVDYMVNDVVSVGAEILYHQFDDFDNSGADVDATTVAARVSYHF